MEVMRLTGGGVRAAAVVVVIVLAAVAAECIITGGWGYKGLVAVVLVVVLETVRMASLLLPPTPEEGVEEVDEAVLPSLGFLGKSPSREIFNRDNMMTLGEVAELMTIGYHSKA